MGLGYDADHDMIVILVREAVPDSKDPEEASEVRFWCTRAQIRLLADWSKELVNRGRPICPQCGQPMDPKAISVPKRTVTSTKPLIIIRKHILPIIGSAFIIAISVHDRLT